MLETVPEGRMLRAWLDTWHGLGDIVSGMNRQGYDVRLSQSVFGWRAEFCRKQVNPSPKWVGQASASEPWRAVQWAALDTLLRVSGRRIVMSLGSGKLSHSGSPILSQAGSPMLSHRAAGHREPPGGA